MKNVDAWVKALVSRLDTVDGALAAEIRGLRGARRAVHQTLRNIVLRVGRPVLAIVGGVPRLEFSDSERRHAGAVGDGLHDVAGRIPERRGVRLRAAPDGAGAHRGDRTARGRHVRSVASLDPFDGDEEGAAAVLTDPGQITFRRGQSVGR